MQRLEQSKPLAGISGHGQQAHLHPGFQFLVCLGHVLRQGLLPGGEEQQAPFLHLAPGLAAIIGARLAGAVTQHVHRFADDPRVTHANFVEHQQPVRVRGGDALQGVVSRAPRTHQARATPY
ncbi:hypothetical protein D9M70_410290 [compost metagenome]